MAKYAVRFILSLLLLSGFIFSIYAVVEIDNDYHTQYAHTINVIGRQRMLSQRMVNFTNQLWGCELQACRPQAEARLIGHIRKARNLFQQSFVAFTSGKQDDQNLIKFDQDIYNISGVDEEEFDRHVEQFAGLIDKIISSDQVARIQATIELNEFSEHFLIDIDFLVQAYVAKADYVATRMTLLQYLILSLLAITIPITVIMMFRPLNRDLRKTCDELEKQKDFMHNIIGFMPDPLVIVDAEGDIVVTNKATEEMFGWSEESLLKMNLAQLLDFGVRARHEKMTRHFIEGTEDYSARDMIGARPVEGLTKSGEKIKFSVSLARYVDPAGTNLGIAIIRDMSLLENLNEALEDRIIAAQVAEEAKDRFIRNISHELRTPLNAVIGFSDLLKTGLENTDNIDCADNIREAGLQLLEKINQLIKVATLESRTKKITLSQIDLAGCLNRMKFFWSEQLTDNNHHLVIGEKSPGMTVNMDMDIFSYVMKSILDNVNIHCPPGREVKIYPYREENDSCLIIEDDGNGVLADQLPRIGSPFEKKGHRGLTAQKGGLALSLFLATQQMKSIGGRIHFLSDPGRGFKVILCFQGGENGGNAVIGSQKSEI